MWGEVTSSRLMVDAMSNGMFTGNAIPYMTDIKIVDTRIYNMYEMLDCIRTGKGFLKPPDFRQLYIAGLAYE